MRVKSTHKMPFFIKYLKDIFLKEFKDILETIITIDILLVG